MTYKTMLAGRMPDFLVVGAMKCATTTLHTQLAQQPRIFMSRLKEPCFFSDDPIYAKGIAWYRALFADCPDDSVCGESSTHYTKLPTYPKTVPRIAEHLPDVKIIYIMRHPVDRMVSHYIHEWTQCTINVSIDDAVRRHPELVDYSRYAMQLTPYLSTIGPSRILPVFFERLAASPQEELQRIGSFLGISDTMRWNTGLAPDNVSATRLRRSALRDLFLQVPILRAIRRSLVPRTLRDYAKHFWQMRNRPELRPAVRRDVERVFDEDLAELGGWLGWDLECSTFVATVQNAVPQWHLPLSDGEPPAHDAIQGEQHLGK